MNRFYFFDRFELNNDLLLNEEVYSISTIQLNPTITDRVRLSDFPPSILPEPIHKPNRPHKPTRADLDQAPYELRLRIL